MLDFFYEREAPLMSRAISLKRGERVFLHSVFANPVRSFQGKCHV